MHGSGMPHRRCAEFAGRTSRNALAKPLMMTRGNPATQTRSISSPSRYLHFVDRVPAILHAADENGARGLRQQRLVQDFQPAVVPGDRLQRHRRDAEIASWVARAKATRRDEEARAGGNGKRRDGGGPDILKDGAAMTDGIDRREPRKTFLAPALDVIHSGDAPSSAGAESQLRAQPPLPWRDPRLRLHYLRS